MKKPYMGTIIGSSRRECVFIIFFQLYGSKVGRFEFGVGQYDFNLHIGRKTNQILI